MTTLAAFLVAWREAQFQRLEGECMWNVGLAMVKEGRARMLMVASDMVAAFPGLDERILAALTAPEYLLPPALAGREN